MSNKGIDKENLKERIRTAMLYHVAQYGYQKWIEEALEEIAKEIESGRKESRPPGHFLNG
jgi:hypothetical protein